MQKAYDKEKQAIEETFGGIWIDSTQEFAKFVSAVNTYPTDENGEGVAKTSDYLYLYYRGIGERIIPFASVYLNKGESQNVANELINAWNNGEKEKVREYIDGAYEVARDVNVQGNILDGTDKELSATRENDRLGSELSQLGRYYYTPELYSKVKRVDSGSRGKGKVAYSLITPEMDASYLDAVERGDMEAAQQLVLEAAEKAGYINDDSWRMNHRAPRMDEENANPFNTEKIVPEDFWEHPEWYSNIRHSSETSESYYAMKPAIDKYKRLMAEGKTEEAENVTITMYRGVDKTANKREASFRNGDWITPSRSYALLSAPYGKARVISQEVKLKDIWWDGNSINEWGYDDGANYGYRDTKNNRKLLDPVTYDDNGNVIPLSERFNPKKADIRFSLLRPTNEEVTFDNFFKSTSAVFEAMPKSEVPQRETDYASERWDGFGVSSRYWYGEDERGKYVIRESNHWSSLLHGERTRAAFEDDPIFKNSLNLLCAFGFPISTFFLIFAELKK